MLINVSELSKQRCRSSILVELKYTTTDNFMGRPIMGYSTNATDIALLTPTPAEQLCAVQNYLIDNYHYGLIIYDAYRPKRASQDMLDWSKKLPAGSFELSKKVIHYPDIEKSDLFKLGYVAENSDHNYGNTVDVFLINLLNNQELAMGACFDFFGEKSHSTACMNEIGEDAFRHRKILAEAMQKFGFISYEKEFWHFSYKEKETSTPFDIEIS